MKKFPLQHIELHIDDQLIEQAEQLLVDSKLLKLNELQPFLWAAKFDDHELVETEIHLGRSDVKAVSCDCEIFRSAKICSHITAALLALREQRAKQQEVQEKAAPSRPHFVKLTTASLLKSIAINDLKQFVQEYARDNRPFALALKARFAHELIHHDDGEQYQHALASILNNIRRPGTRITKGGIKQIGQLVAMLFEQTETAAQEVNFQKAFIILKTILEQTTAKLILIDKLPAPIRSSFTKSIGMAKVLLDEDLAPQLRQRVLKFMLEVSFQPFFLQHALFDPAIQVILPHLNEASLRQELTQKLEGQLDQEITDEQAYIKLLLLRSDLLLRGKASEAEFADLIGKHVQQPSVLLKSLQKAAESKKWEVLEALANFGFNLPYSDASQYILKMAMLRAATETNKKTAIRKWAMECLLISLQPDYYHAIKNTYSKNWAGHLDKLLKQLNTLPPSPEKEMLLATIYTEEQQWEELCLFIRGSHDLSLLTRFDEKLGTSDEAALKQLYKDMLDDYLSNHLGRQAAIQTRKLMAHLHRSGHSKWARQFVHFIRKQFPERHSLMEELEVF